MAGKRKQKKPARRAGKLLYRMVVALSAVIVVLFCAYKLTVKPPSTAAGNPASAPPGSPVQPPVSQTGEASGPVRRENTFTFLLAASDQAGGGADTIMVCTYDTVNQTVGLVSVPRDTLVREGKINALYNKGVDVLMDAVSDLLGIPIDHYIAVDIQGFVKVIDAVGGIEFDVPVRMAYDDPTQDLHIHFQPGMQTLTGKDALLVARCRKNSDGPGEYPNNVYDAYPDADIGRTRTQQQLLTTVIKKVLSRPDRIPQVIGTILDYVDTDLELANILWFIEPALSFDFSAGLSTATLPGDGNVSYRDSRGYNWGQYCYQLYPEECLEIINSLINPYDQDIGLEDLNIFQVN